MSTILVIEDEGSIADMLQLLLESHGYGVLLARDGVEALELLVQQRPDLVLSDVMMPRLDGPGVVAALRADPAYRALPIVLMSAGISNVNDLNGTVDAFIRKPFAISELLGLLHRLLEPAL